MLKHRASLARGPHLPANKTFMIDFCLCGAISNLKAFCFGAIPDIMIELIVYGGVPQSRQSVIAVAQCHRNQIIRGPLVIGKNNV